MSDKKTYSLRWTPRETSILIDVYGQYVLVNPPSNAKLAYVSAWQTTIKGVIWHDPKFAKTPKQCAEKIRKLHWIWVCVYNLLTLYTENIDVAFF